MKKKLTASPLAKYRKLEIGRWYNKHPEKSFREVMLQFGVTYDQARRACIQYDAGMLFRSKARRTKNASQIAKTGDADGLLEKQYCYAIAQLEADVKIPYSERIPLLEKLISSRKTLQFVKLESHIKKTDAAIIAGIVRRFMPESSDEQVIQIYREEFEKWKLIQK